MGWRTRLDRVAIEGPPELQRLAGQVTQRKAGRGGLHAAGVPDQQRRGQLLFQFRHAAADGRARQPQIPRRTGKAAGLGDAIGTLESVGAAMPEPEDVPPDDGEDAATEEARISASLHESQLKSAALIDKLETLRASAGVEIPGAVELAFTPEDRAKMDRAKVSDAVMAADLAPALTIALLKSSKPATPETVDARIAEARAISVICAAAKLPDVAADYVARGVDLETARAQLLAVVAESGPELSTSHPKQDVARSKTKAQTIYEQRAAART